MKIFLDEGVPEQLGEVRITNDENMEAEQPLRLRPFAVLVLSATNWPVIAPYVANIAAALKDCKPGRVKQVECGRFVRMKT